MTDTPLARLWSVATVARRLGVSRSMVFRQIRARRLAAIRIGRYWRVEPSAVSAFIERYRQAADAAELEPATVDDRQLPLALDPPRADDEELVERVGLSSSLDPEDVPF